MSDIKFACPNCQQHIQCGIGYAGMQIPCPTCQSVMTVPTPAGAPVPAMAAAPAPASALRMSAAPATPPPPPVPVEATGERTCPSCGNPVAPQAIMCIKCGTNLRTGQKMTGPGGRPGAVRPMAAARTPVVWYKNPESYAGIAFILLVLLYGSAWLNPLGGLAYLGMAVLMWVAGSIIVLVAAFKESVGTGFLTMCVPFYVLYFVYAQCESKFVKSMWSIGIIAEIGIMFLPHANGD